VVISVLDRRHAAESVVGAKFVVVDQKAPSGLANVLQPREQALVEHLFAIGAIEAFDVGALIGLA